MESKRSFFVAYLNSCFFLTQAIGTTSQELPKVQPSMMGKYQQTMMKLSVSCIICLVEC